MPATSSPLPSRESPIPYLTSLSVNGNNISNFNYEIEEYSYRVSAGTASVSIGGVKKNNAAIVSGLGTISLTGDTTVAQIVVTAPAGNTKDTR